MPQASASALPGAVRQRNSAARFYLMLAALAGAYFLFAAGFSFRRILTYKADIDVAQFNTIFWTLLHTGSPVVMDPAIGHTVNWFGEVHFSPIYYLLLPWYALWPSAFSLQLLHCACLAAAAVPLALGLRCLALSDRTALALTALMLFNPFYLDAGLWEFHESSLGCLLIACAYFALLKQSRKGFLIALALLLLTKEHYGLTAAGFGLVWWGRHRDGRFGLGVTLAGCAACWLVLGVVMPALNGGALHPMLRQDALPRYVWLKGDAQSIFFNAVYLFFSSARYNIPGIVYVGLLLLTVGFMPLAALLYLLPAAADAATILLSSDYFPRSLAAYHTAALIPVLIMASGVALSRCGWLEARACLPVLALIVTVNVLLFSKNGVTAYELLAPSETVDFNTVRKVKTMVGTDSASVQSNVAYLLSSGSGQLSPFPMHGEEAKFIVLYLRHPYRAPYYRVFGDIYRLSAGRHYAAAGFVLAHQPDWGIVFFDHDWLVLEKGEPDRVDVRAQLIDRLGAAEVEAGTPGKEITWTPALP